jgi:hypothetical protein
MKPDRRRLLIPGLLIALLIVVVLAATMRRAGAEPTPLPIAPHTQVSVMSDPRIRESSGLAASQAHPGIVYTNNDSGDRARIFAVDIGTGRVVGVTSVANAKWHDAEAMALVKGKIWVADVGSSRPPGEERALYVFDEPGPGNHRVSAVRYPITLDGGAVEFEAIAVLPGRVDLYGKGWPISRAFQIVGELTKSGPNVARLTPRTAPAWTADAAATPDGRYVLLHGAVEVEVRNAWTWQLVHVDVIPMLSQGETIALEASGRSYLIGSEGANSPLVRLAFDPATFTTPPPSIDVKEQIRAQHPVKSILWVLQARLRRAGPFVLAVPVLVGTAWWISRRRHRRERERRIRRSVTRGTRQNGPHGN